SGADRGDPASACPGPGQPGPARISAGPGDSSPAERPDPCRPCPIGSGPMPASRPFAFLVHPRRNVAEDLGRVWSPLGRVPERYYDAALRRLAVPPAAISNVSVQGHDGPVGQIVLVPYG